MIKMEKNIVRTVSIGGTNKTVNAIDVDGFTVEQDQKRHYTFSVPIETIVKSEEWVNTCEPAYFVGIFADIIQRNEFNSGKNLIIAKNKEKGETTLTKLKAGYKPPKPVSGHHCSQSEQIRECDLVAFCEKYNKNLIVQKLGDISYSSGFSKAVPLNLDDVPFITVSRTVSGTSRKIEIVPDIWHYDNYSVTLELFKMIPAEPEKPEESPEDTPEEPEITPEE